MTVRVLLILIVLAIVLVLLKWRRCSRVLLVSSGFHLRRGMLYFAHFGIHAVPVRADYVDGVRSWLPLSYNFAMADWPCTSTPASRAITRTTRWAGTCRRRAPAHSDYDSRITIRRISLMSSIA